MDRRAGMVRRLLALRRHQAGARLAPPGCMTIPARPRRGHGLRGTDTLPAEHVKSMRIRYFCTFIVALAACSPPQKSAHDDAWFNTPDGTWTPDSGVVSEMKSVLDVALGTALDERPNSTVKPARYWFQYFGYGSGTDKSIAIAGGPFPVPKN